MIRMKIQLRLEIICNRKLLYACCEKSEILVQLLGKYKTRRYKTIPVSALPLLKKLGFEFDILGDPAIVKMLEY
jgi:hypothetical protein